MNSNDLINNIGKNANDTAALIWSVADDLVGAYKPHEYGLVILPMTVIKRFHDCLLPTHRAVLDTYKKVEKLAVKDGFLTGFALIGCEERAGIYTSLIRERIPLDTLDFELLKHAATTAAFPREQRRRKFGGAV